MGAGGFQRDREPAPRTLGDLLYPDSTQPRVSEHEWVTLVRIAAAGDQRALQVLYDRTHRMVFTLALRITEDRQTAEEVTIDVFHDVWRRAATYQVTGGTVVGWIMNQARSRAIDRVRFEQRRKRRPPAQGEDPLPASGSRGPYETLHLIEQGQALRAALKELTSDERQVIEAAYFSELTYEEVAARLDQPLGTVKTRMRSGLGKLRRALSGMTRPR